MFDYGSPQSKTTNKLYRIQIERTLKCEKGNDFNFTVIKI